MRSDMLRSGLAGAVAALATIAVEVAGSGIHVAGEGVDAIAAYGAIAVALATFAALVAGLLVALVYGLGRLVTSGNSGAGDGRWWGWCDLPEGAGLTRPGEIAQLIHAGAITVGVFLPAVTLTVADLCTRFREPTLIGLVAAVAASLWALFAISCGLGVRAFLRRRGRAVHLLPARMVAVDPLASPRAAIVLWLLLAWMAVLVASAAWPQFQMVFPLRVAVSLSLFTLMLLEGGRFVRALCDGSARRRRALLIAALAMVTITALTLPLVSSPAARRAAMDSPTLTLVLDAIRHVSDVDRDGYSSLLGGGDCAAFDGDIHPGARDKPGDNIDQNCFGGDFAPTPRPSPLPDMELPAALARPDYSIVLITVDAFRYDRTGGGGFGRAVTPNLDALAARGVWFDNFYTSGSMTKDVLPTLVCSQFMEELPLGERIQTGQAGMPRLLEPAAVTLAEVMRAAGYRTAMFTASQYFDGWGIDQGMEEVVNLPSDGPVATAPALTDRALAWLESLADDQRALLWIHYMEPHHPYVDHAGSPTFGDSEADKYLAELRFVDQQVGRFASWADAPTRAHRTIIAVTSDHGEELGERGRFGHGVSLWSYLVHVPLLIAVPGVTPRRARTPASTLDLAPTLVALAGVAPDPSWSGRAHIAEIAHAIDKPERIVFAAEKHKRIYAAITTNWKLMRDEYRNLFQLIDVANDPGEERDASADHPEVFARLRAAMVGWRERVLGVDG